MNNQLELKWQGGTLWLQICWKNRIWSCSVFILCFHSSAQAWHVRRSYNWALLKAFSNTLPVTYDFARSFSFCQPFATCVVSFYDHAFYKHHFLKLSRPIFIHVLPFIWSYCTNMNRTQLPLRQPLSGIWPTTVDFAEGTPVKNAHANPEYIEHKSAMTTCSDH